MNRSRDKKEEDVAPFKLAMDGGFQSRSNDVFANLGHIEAKHNAYQKARSKTRDGRDDKNLIKEDPKDDSVQGRRQHNTSRSWASDHHRTRPSDNKHSPHTDPSSNDHDRGFKRPRNPAPRARRRPENHVYPEGFTYFNMNDVSDYSMSDKSNTTAALSFLSSLESGGEQKKQKTAHDVEMDVDADAEASSGSSEHKIIFNKPRRKQSDNSESAMMLSSGRQGCVTMPEYVVGQKTTSKKTKPKRTSKLSDKAAVAISHVLEEDAEDGEDEDEDVMSLQVKPTRTVFSGCMDDDSDEPMDEEKKSSCKKNTRSGKKRVIRSHKDDDDDDDGGDDSDEIRTHTKNSYDEFDGVD